MSLEEKEEFLKIMNRKSKEFLTYTQKFDEKIKVNEKINFFFFKIID